MKILIHGLNFAPEPTGIGKYTGEMAEWLAEQGHQVRVVAAPPYYPQWRVWSGHSPWRYAREVLHPNPRSAETKRTGNTGSLVVYRCPIWVPARLTAAKRLAHLASFALSSLPVMLRQAFWKPDVVWSVEPALFCAPATLLTARICRAKSWLHVQDFELDAAFSLGILQGNTPRRIGLALEKWLTSGFDVVSSITGRMVDRLREKGVAETRRRLFQNWVDISAIHPLPGPSPMRKELGINEDTCVALYSGNFGAKQGLDILIEASRHLVGRDILFVICGDGGIKNSLIQAAHGLPNVRFLDLQPKERLNDLLNLADIHLLPQRADTADLVMPSKLTGMLASGRPVVATAHPNTEIGNAVKSTGFTVPPGNVRKFADAIQSLAGDRSLRLTLGEAARNYAQTNWSSDTVLRRFEQNLLDFARSYGSSPAKPVRIRVSNIGGATEYRTP